MLAIIRAENCHTMPFNFTLPDLLCLDWTKATHLHSARLKGTN